MRRQRDGRHRQVGPALSLPHLREGGHGPALLARAHPFDLVARRPVGAWEQHILHPSGRACLIVGRRAGSPATVRFGHEPGATDALAELLTSLDGAWRCSWHGPGPGLGFFESLGAAVSGDASATKRRYTAIPSRSQAPHAATVLAGADAILSLSAADLSALHRLWCEGLADQPDDDNEAPAIDDWLAEWNEALTAGGALGVIHHGTRPVALTAAVRCDELVYVEATAVARSHRGQHLALTVKAALHDWAARAGVARLITDVRDTNPAMLATNRALGYQPVPAFVASHPG